MTNEDNTFAGWVESPFHMVWRENLTELERAEVDLAIQVAKTRDVAYILLYLVVLIAKLGLMLDTLTGILSRTEEQRMELLMPKRD